MRVLLFALILIVGIAEPSQGAQFLEVRREAWLYAEPSRDAAQVTRITLREHSRPYLAKLLEAQKKNGYYHVQLPPGEQGWIYQSFVRGRPSTAASPHRAYQRSLYRHWIDVDGNCRDTRAEVLIRDSEPNAVKYKGARQCEVSRGVWHDPYSGQTFREPRTLDVDHVVPLKNAHDSGAWQWTAERRRDYANYLRYERHLLAVKASENRKKGDKGPDRYLPPRREFHCEYARIWLKIKGDWQLEIPPSEQAAIDRTLAACG